MSAPKHADSPRGFAATPNYIARRSPLICTHGIVSTSQPLASEIGLRILKGGGTAADACVAAVAALNCTEPCMCGMGGDAFCLYYEAATGKVHALNGSGAAPSDLTLELARATGGPGGKQVKAEYEMLDPSSPHAVTVPGAAALWADCVAMFGRKPLAEVLQPAIELAEEGFPINTIASGLWHANLNQLTERWGGLAGNPGASALLRPDGTPPKPGEYMRMPELAQTFRLLAQHGPDGFYKGRVAKAVVDALRSKGGVMSEADLASHRTSIEEAISAPFAGHTVYQLPPNGSGLVSLLALRILDSLPPLPETATDADRMHRIAEALRLAFADGVSVVGDFRRCEQNAAGTAASPAASPSKKRTRHGDAADAAAASAAAPPRPKKGEAANPSTASGIGARDVVSTLLGDRYTAERAVLITDGVAMDAALAGGAAAALAGSSSETVYLTAVDGEGNACSFICSNYCAFGSGLVPTGCGFSLHNRGCNFRLGLDQPSHPNLLAPGKRPYHTIIPSMVTDASGQLVASFGVMGGFMQPQGHVQVLTHMLTRGLDPQSALDQPRLCLEPADHDGDAEKPAAMQLPPTRSRTGLKVCVEEGVTEEELKKLRGYGHEVVGHISGRARAMFGRGQMIVVVREEAKGTPTAKARRILWAGSDGRGDGCAMGW